MIILKKLISVTVILTFLCVYLPETVFAQAETIKRMTTHSVKISTTPEEKIPVETIDKKKTNPWVWIGLGVGTLAIGGAAASGGGGGSDDGPHPTPAETEGDISVSW